jgi:twitching motility protein PilT
MERIFKAAIDRGASDLHIKAGDVFRARIHGKLVALTKQVLTPEQTRTIALRLMGNDDDRARIDKIRDYDCSWGAEGIGRFRVNILRQRSSFSIVMRVIPFEAPTFDGLGLPRILANIAETERGMILVTGVTGSGKSSTMAALIDRINATKSKHIVTLENPIEFLHRDQQSSVTQREIGVDTDGFRSGLRAALRQDPDVIMIGEMRDAETIDTAMKAAETGHLLISTLHTPDAQSTIMRVMAMFPPEEQDVVRIRLAESLAAVVSQRLLPRADGSGRVPAVEVMINTPTIRELILDGSRIGEIRDYIVEGREQYGMQTFDQHLFDLVTDGTVEYEVALAAATRPSDFELQMRMLSRRSSGTSRSSVRAALAAADTPAPPRTSTPGASSTPPSTPTKPDESGIVGLSGGFDFLSGNG